MQFVVIVVDLVDSKCQCGVIGISIDSMCLCSQEVWDQRGNMLVSFIIIVLTVIKILEINFDYMA